MLLFMDWLQLQFRVSVCIFAGYRVFLYSQKWILIFAIYPIGYSDIGLVTGRTTGLSLAMTRTTSLWPLYTLTCISQHLQLRTGGFCWSKVLLPACPC